MVSFSAVGDIMLSRDVGKKIGENDALYPFKYISDRLRSADILFGNLETPLTSRGIRCRTKDLHVSFRADPITAEGLRSAGFKILSIANNHILDYGMNGVVDTINNLNRLGIKPIGISNYLEPKNYVTISCNGIKIGFLSYNSFPLPNMGKYKKGDLTVDQLTLSKVRKDLFALRNSFSPKIIIVSLHWGLDYFLYPVPFQMLYARKMIDWGADIILGHHPHVIQGIEKYRNGIIVYSLGNFVFDEPFPDTKRSFIFSCNLGENGLVDFDIQPVVLNENYQPKIAVGLESKKIIDKIENLSQEYSTTTWKRDYSKNPAAVYFLINIKSGIKNRNIIKCLRNFPLKFLLFDSFLITSWKICKMFTFLLKRILEIVFDKINQKKINDN